MTAAPADALVMFGITGDLAKKKLIPALYELTAEDRLEMPVVGAARSDWDDERLKQHIREILAGRDDAVIERLCARISYVAGDYQDPAVYREIHAKLAGAALPVFFMAIPPSLFDDVANGLAEVGCNQQGRLVIEKPSRSAASASSFPACRRRCSSSSRRGPSRSRVPASKRGCWACLGSVQWLRTIAQVSACPGGQSGWRSR